MPPTVRVDPFSSSKFLVEIDGIPAAAFSAVSGIEADVAVIDYRPGNDNVPGARKLPGEAKYSNLILKRGITTDLSLWNWMLETLDGNVTRRNIAVVLLNDAGTEVLRFKFTEAWPVKWSGPNLSADANEVAFETLEIAHEGLLVSS